MPSHLIIRIDKNTLEQCKENTKDIPQLIHFNKISDSEKLDMGFALKDLRKLAEWSFQIPEVLVSLYLAENGQYLLNNTLERYKHSGHMVTSLPDKYFVESDIAYIDLELTRFVADSLPKIERESFFNLLPSNHEEANKWLGQDYTKHPMGVLMHYLDKLTQFFHETAKQNKVIVTWWD